LNRIDARSFTGAHCDPDNSLVVARVRERLSVNKRTPKKFDVETFILKTLNDVGAK
jgi:hypothetical protein